MRKLSTTFRSVLAAIGIFTVASALTACQEDNGYVSRDQAMSKEEATKELDKMMRNINWSSEPTPRVTSFGSASSNEDPGLPPIDNFSLTVNPDLGMNMVRAEIFASTEKSGNGTDGWMVEVARDFNRQNIKLSNGKEAKIAVRRIASGTGHEYIRFKQYQPDAFSPSNTLWVKMVESNGIKMTEVSDRMVGNVAGIVMREALAKQIEQEKGSVSVETLVDEVIQGKLVTGYTDPYASSTGLNFLVSVLNTFAGGDTSKMLNNDVASTFEAFQANIPFVALTTLQMRDSVARDGSLDTFVMEYQTYSNTPELQADYRFVPFGVRHDNPLYAVGNISSEKMEVLQKFAEFSKQEEYTRLATRYGFNGFDDYDSSYSEPEGTKLVAAQSLWKTKKDGGRKVAAMFIADISGSMEGTRIAALKKALRIGAGKISTENSIGLVTFSNTVQVAMPLKPFNSLQKATFLEVVNNMQVGGNTAMYDAIAVGLKQLEGLGSEYKPVLFVLTDGETNQGYNYSQMSPVIMGLNVPVHTIAFEGKFDELSNLSSLVEAANINASEDDVGYKIGAMLNSQM